MPNRDRTAGEFCWINMLTPDPTGARQFFGSVLGWTYQDASGFGGHIILVDGTPAGGLWDLNAPQTPKGTPPVIGVMVQASDADAVGARAAQLGGEMRGGMDIGENGRMVMCADPNGAVFDLWQPRKQPGMVADGRAQGAPSWFETLTTDVAKATTFYESLFGWSSEVSPMGETSYTVFNHGPIPVAGMMAISPHMGPMPAHWGVYFTVNQLDESLKLATSLGASICVSTKSAPGVGRFAGLVSPQGVTFSLIQYDIPA